MKKKILTIVSIVLVAAAAIAVGYYVMIPAQKYQKAEDRMEAGAYEEAAAIFASLGDYKDSAARATECRYHIADGLEKEGRISAAAMAFGALGDYEDAKGRSLALWKTVAVRDTLAMDGFLMLAIAEDGQIMASCRRDDVYVADDSFAGITAVDVAIGYDIAVVLCEDGTVKTNGALGFNTDDYMTWNDIVALDVCSSWFGGEAMVALRADGTVVYEPSLYHFENQKNQDNVSGWRNIVDVACSMDHTVGLRANGTVIATGSNKCGECDVEDWKNIVAIEAAGQVTMGLTAEGRILIAYNGYYPAPMEMYAEVMEWTDVVDFSITSGRVIALKKDGTILCAGNMPDGGEACFTWDNIATVVAQGPLAIHKDGSVSRVGHDQSFACITDWRNVARPHCTAIEQLDDKIVVDVEAEKNDSTLGFFNKYGTETTICAHSGCGNYIARYGDTNCCTLHSNRCGNCSCYIDEDAMYCMDCLEGYFGK